jgi:hypothetical protein
MDHADSVAFLEAEFLGLARSVSRQPLVFG